MNFFLIEVATFVFEVATFALEVATFALEVATLALEVATFVLEVATFAFGGFGLLFGTGDGAWAVGGFRGRRCADRGHRWHRRLCEEERQLYC